MSREGYIRCFVQNAERITTIMQLSAAIAEHRSNL